MDAILKMTPFRLFFFCFSIIWVFDHYWRTWYLIYCKQNLIPIPNTMPKFKDLSQSAQTFPIALQLCGRNHKHLMLVIVVEQVKVWIQLCRLTKLMVASWGYSHTKILWLRKSSSFPFKWIGGILWLRKSSSFPFKWIGGILKSAATGFWCVCGLTEFLFLFLLLSKHL